MSGSLTHRPQPDTVYTIIEHLHCIEGARKCKFSVVATFTDLDDANAAASLYARDNIYRKAKEVDNTAHLEPSVVNNLHKYVITSGPFKYRISVLNGVQDPGISIHLLDREPLRFGEMTSVQPESQ